MQTNTLKPTTRFIGGASLKSLAGKCQFNGLAAIKTSAVAVIVPKAGCKVFLVGGDGENPSDWHRITMEQLEKAPSDLEGLKAMLDDHLKRIMAPAERLKNGLKPTARLSVTDVVIDAERNLLFLNFAANEMDIDEHGLVAVYEGAAWRLEDGGYVKTYIEAVAAPERESLEKEEEDSELEIPPVNPCGKWRGDEQATIALLKKRGEDDKWSRQFAASVKVFTWIITESRFVQKQKQLVVWEYEILSLMIDRNKVRLELKSPKAQWIQELKIVGDLLFSDFGFVLKKEAEL
jgi:hypothetical protein